MTARPTDLPEEPVEPPTEDMPLDLMDGLRREPPSEEMEELLQAFLAREPSFAPPPPPPPIPALLAAAMQASRSARTVAELEAARRLLEGDAEAFGEQI